MQENYRASLAAILMVALGVLMVALGVEAQVVPLYDEVSMARMEEVSASIAASQTALDETTSSLENERERIARRIDRIEGELLKKDQRRPPLHRLSAENKEKAQRAHEERMTEVKSRYLEAIAEQHAVDLELFRAFEEYAGDLLSDLEIYAGVLGPRGPPEGFADETGERAMRALQFGTARALGILDRWEALTRGDPRFASLWATARMIRRTQRVVSSDSGAGVTLQAVTGQIVHARALLHQTRAALVVFDHEGLIIQVAAQNLVLRLLDSSISAVSGIKLPETNFEQRIGRVRRLLSDEPDARTPGNEPLLAGFDECLIDGVCE